MTSKNLKSKTDNKKMKEEEHSKLSGLKIFGPVKIEVKKIDLDDFNMRFKPHYKEKLKQSEIKELLDEKFDIKTLEKQVLRHGQVYMPIHVIQKGGRFVVKDGSRRVRVLQRLSQENKN